MQKIKLPPKSHLTYLEQINRLLNRGMIIEDKSRAIKKLTHIGYYRLSGYWYTCRKQQYENRNRLSEFEDNTSFEKLYDLYLFDKDLRIQLFCGIERIENYIKALIAYNLGAKDTCAYLNEEFFLINTEQKKEHFQKLRQKIENSIKNSKEDSIKWNRENYINVPIWVVCDIWDFGTLSNIYKLLKIKYQLLICKKLGLKKATDLVSCLHILNIIRNRCAHNARLWNYSLKPHVPKSIFQYFNISFSQNDLNNSSRIFDIILIIWFFISKISHKSTWLEDIITLLKRKPNLPNVNFYAMGFANENIEELELIFNGKKINDNKKTTIRSLAM